MKKVKLKLSKSQMESLLQIINQAGISLIVAGLDELALKEQYTKLFLKLQLRVLNLKPKNNSLKLSITECWAINVLMTFGFTGYEFSVLKAICREIDQQIVNM